MFTFFFYTHFSIITILKDFADVANTPVFSAITDLRKLESDFESFQDDAEFSSMRQLKGTLIKAINKRVLIQHRALPKKDLHIL